MKIWDDITTTALMGTERHPGKLPAEANSPLDIALARIDKRDPETVLLAAAGLVTIYRKAGAKCGVSTVELPAPAIPDTLPECSPKAANLLAIVFTNGEYRELLPEALTLLIDAGKRVSPALLPDLLDLGRQNTSIRDDLMRVIDNRGTWLAGQNPDWSYAALMLPNHAISPMIGGKGVELGEWALAPRAARVAALRALGERDPATARELLRSTWSTESADDRAALLAARIVNLAQEDEDFLEAALDDRSALVRGVAVDLLSRLPESRYVRRMVERARRMVSVRYDFAAGHVLEVNLPRERDAAMIRDGIEADGSTRQSPPGTTDEGIRSGWLRQIVASIPPSHWSREFDRPPADILDLVDKSDWADVLRRALIQAANRHPDIEWTLALVRALIQNRSATQQLTELAPAIGRLPATEIEPIVLIVLDRAPLGAPGPLRTLLNTYPGRWSPTLTQAVLGKINSTLTQFGDHQTISAVATLIREMALRIPPSLAEEAQAAVAGGPTETNMYWARQIDQAFAILTMRRDLEEAILEKSS
jgi:hypothetical protein